MDCPRCHHSNPTGGRFCNDCGGPLPLTLAAPFVAPDAYTPRHLAGRILTSRAAVEGERKQVTILFADLKSSLELIAGRDAEDARAMLDPVLERMMEAVHHYEGTVNQVMGDGIMALFGAPLAHEDHARRACYAALRMQETIARHAAEVARRDGRQPRVRIGLNSGEVVVRSIGSDLHMDYSAVGESTHLAARMEQLAQPGSILLTAHTLRLAEGQVDATLVGPVPVKGFAEPVIVYELKAASAARSRLEAAAPRGLTPFVGRQAEMAALSAALAAAAAGRGQIVAVVGEPGAGKSRIVWEAARSGSLAGWLVLEAHAIPYGRGSPYLPIVELLRAYFRLDGSATLPRERVAAVLGPEEAEHFMAPVLALLGQPVDERWWMELSPDQQRRRTLNAVKHVLTRAAATRPVCVIVEDLHWADPETLAVLDSVVEGLAASRIALVVTYRPEHRHEWASTSGYRQIRVDTFSATAAAPMLRAVLGEAPELAPVAAIIAERTDGNPFFLEETVRHLAETGALTGEPGAYRLGRLPAIAQVPDTVHAVIASRIDRVPPEDKRVLQEAAAIGKEFSRGLLEAIGDLALDDLGPTLARLQAREFVYELRIFPEAEYAFRHALTHDVAYAGLVRDRRHALDARIVAALEADPRDSVGHADRLAHHALRGELWDKAVAHCRKAGTMALARFANRGAASHFEQALTALGHLAPDSDGGGRHRHPPRAAVRAAAPRQYCGESSSCSPRPRPSPMASGTVAGAAASSRFSATISRCASRFRRPSSTGRPRSTSPGRRRPHARRRHQLGARGGVLRMGRVPALGGGRHRGDGRGRRDLDREVRHGAPASGIRADAGGLVTRRARRFCRRRARGARGPEHRERARAPAQHHLRVARPRRRASASRRGGGGGRSARARAGHLGDRRPARGAARGGGPAGVSVRGGGPSRRRHHAARARRRPGARPPTPDGQRATERGMAEAYLATGRLEEALPLAQLYVELARMVDGRGHVAWALHLLADVASRRDPNDATAESSIDACLALARELGMRPLEARAWTREPDHEPARPRSRGRARPRRGVPQLRGTGMLRS